MRCSDTTHLLVFARLPIAGRVKTRLAAGIGDVEAAQLYKCCAQHVIKQAASVPGATCTVWYADPPTCHHAMETWMHDLFGQSTCLV